MSAHKHGEIVSGFLGDGWHAECQCGWRSPVRDYSPEVETDLALHRAAQLTDWPVQDSATDTEPAAAGDSPVVGPGSSVTGEAADG